MNHAEFLKVIWPHVQHLNFGEASAVADFALSAAQDQAFKLTKAKIAEAGVKEISQEEADRRDLKIICSKGLNTYHVTVWGDSAPKIMVGVRADNALDAISKALAWGRKEWWRDQRNLGIEKIEQVVR